MGGRDLERVDLVLFFRGFGLDELGAVSLTSLLDRSVVHELTGFP